MRRRRLVLLAAVLFAACGGPPAPGDPVVTGLPPIEGVGPGERVEILWDTWGIPHIHARDAAAAFYAFGWSQMHSHGDLVLRLYGQARGRAAEYWGETYVDSDRWVRVNGVPDRATEWLAAQPAHVRSFLDAFVAGMNGYAAQHRSRITDAYRVVLPVTAEDVLAHMQRTILFTFVANPQAVMQGAEAAGATGGSNGWAVGPERSSSGNALLLANPHLPWYDVFTWYEAQVAVGEMNAYGVALVGHPTLGIAFNDYLGWTNTVNTYDGADLYELTLSGDGYLFDGDVRPFHVRMDTLRVRRDGTVEAVPFPVAHSVHGPVVARSGNRAVALRVAGLDAPGAIEQLWELLHARDRITFETTLARLQVPMFTYLYADREGHILHVFNGRVPVRPRGDVAYWRGVVPGDSSSTLWTSVHPYPELPRVLDPPTGWLQNANDPPWTTTIPWAIDPARYPAYMAPRRFMGFRAQRSARMLVEDASITLEELVRYKHSTRMEAADHIVEDLIAAARNAEQDTLTVSAADVLERWNRTADANSRGAVLFAEFFRELRPRPSSWDVPWSEEAPLVTPDGLADPAGAVRALGRAAARVLQTWGRLDIPWGEVHRFRSGDVDLPANGGDGALGIFRAIDYDDAPDNLRVAVGGDSFVAAIEFGETVTARALLSYGNASQPGSPHRADQLPLLARQELRPVWRTREEVLANLERREVF